MYAPDLVRIPARGHCAIAEGREVCVGGISWDAKEPPIRFGSCSKLPEAQKIELGVALRTGTTRIDRATVITCALTVCTPARFGMSASPEGDIRIARAKGPQTAGIAIPRSNQQVAVPSVPSPKQNHLLNALPSAVGERLFPHLKLVNMARGSVVYESGAPLRLIYFPTDCVISLLYVLADGSSAEISVVGNEGAVGLSLFIGGETTTSPCHRTKRRFGLSALRTQAQERAGIPW